MFALCLLWLLFLLPCFCWHMASWCGSLVRRCQSGRPGWLDNPRSPDGLPAGILLFLFLLHMLCRRLRTSQRHNDKAHLPTVFYLLLLLLLLRCFCLRMASWSGSLARRSQSGRPGWLDNPRSPGGLPASVLLFLFLLQLLKMITSKTK